MFDQKRQREKKGFFGLSPFKSEEMQWQPKPNRGKKAKKSSKSDQSSILKSLKKFEQMKSIQLIDLESESILNEKRSELPPQGIEKMDFYVDIHDVRYPEQLPPKMQNHQEWTSLDLKERNKKDKDCLVEEGKERNESNDLIEAIEAEDIVEEVSQSRNEQGNWLEYINKYDDQESPFDSHGRHKPQQKDYLLSSPKSSSYLSNYTPSHHQSHQKQQSLYQQPFSCQSAPKKDSYLYITEIKNSQKAIHNSPQSTSQKSRLMQSQSQNENNQEGQSEKIQPQQQHCQPQESPLSQDAVLDIKQDEDVPKQRMEKDRRQEVIKKSKEAVIEEEEEEIRPEAKSIEFQQIEMVPHKAHQSKIFKGVSSRQYLSRIMSRRSRDDDEIQQIPEDDYMRSCIEPNLPAPHSRIISKDFTRQRGNRTARYLYRPKPPGSLYQDVRRQIDQKTLTWSSLAGGRVPGLVRILQIVEVDGVRYVYGLFWDPREQLMERFVMMPHFLDFYGGELEEYRISESKEKTVQVTIGDFSS